jgi:hypothetical protein
MVSDKGLAQMGWLLYPPAEDTPEYEEYHRAAANMFLNADPNYLAANNTELPETVAHRDECVKRLEAMVEKLSATLERRDQALCLYSEVVRLLEAEAIMRPQEVDNLLARATALAAKK